MTKLFISTLILINTAAFIWCGVNYVTLSSVSTKDAIFKINKMSELASESLQTMESYSPQYRKDHVNDIVSHYANLTEHLASTKDMTIEITDVLFRYIYIFLALSLLNVLSFSFLLLKYRAYFS